MVTMKKVMSSAVMAVVYSALIAGPVAAENRMKEAKAYLDLKANTQNIIPLKSAIVEVLQDRDGVILEAEIEQDHDQVVYEVEMMDSQGKSYEYEVNPLDGQIIEVRENFMENLARFLPFSDSVTAEGGKGDQFMAMLDTIAGDIVSLEREGDDEIMLYEIKSIDNNKVTKQWIDMASGEVVLYHHHNHKE